MCNAEILVTKSFERKSGKSESRPFLQSVEQLENTFQMNWVISWKRSLYGYSCKNFNTNTAKESSKRKALEAQNIYVIIN